MNRSALSCALVLALCLSACAPRQKAPAFHAYYYPECYDPIERLCKDQSYAQEAKGAATGALIGAAGGALLGGILRGDLKGALVGGAIGAAAGGAVGFFKARLDKIQDREQRLNEYQRILGENSRNWDLERSSVERAYMCYREQIRHLKRLVVNKQISKQEFMARMNEIQAGLNNINTYWADAQTRMDARIADGEAFLAQQEEQDRKLAAQKRQIAQRQIQQQRQRTSSQRSKKNREVSAVNNLKNSTSTELDELMRYAQTSKEFA
ncbi:MAG: hypothetical protein IJU76_01770 [Desulfovibrionaceae bacterium]|nr:hypothetical protein [Desulfovibrionaceae bacterium]